MKKETRYNKKQLSTYVLVLLICLFTYVFVISNLKDSSKSFAKIDLEQKNRNIDISNKTKAFKVESSKINNDKFSITVSNISDKIVNGFYITVGDVTYHFELLYSEVKNEILPKHNYTFSVDIDENLYSNTLIIQSVIFKDGLGSGESVYIKAMKDKRYGEKLEFLKGKEFIENIQLSIDESLLVKFEKFEQKFLSKSSRSDDLDNEDVNSGKHFGRQRVLSLIQILDLKSKQESSFNFESEKNKVTEKLTNWINNL